MAIKLMFTGRAPNSSQLDVTIERGWWIFKWVETWKGSIGEGWLRKGVPPSTLTGMFLDRVAFEYWSNRLIHEPARAATEEQRGEHEWGHCWCGAYHEDGDPVLP